MDVNCQKYILTIQQFPFGFHAGGIEKTPNGPVDHNQPANTILVFGPLTEDGLPDTEYLIRLFDWRDI